MAVADVFDALTSDRVYRKAFSVEEAVRMMRAERARHFDPVLLDAFMKIIDQAGDDVRAPQKTEPLALVKSTREKYSTALQRGDAEMAEEAIARALEEGLSPRALHTEVIVPALRQVGELWREGELDLSREQLATSITRRVLASVYRYILGSTESTRERVLLAGVEGDEHTLELEMVRDQLAAAGYQTVLDTELSVDGLREAVESEDPDVVVLGATVVAAADAVKSAVRDLRATHPGPADRARRRRRGRRPVARTNDASAGEHRGVRRGCRGPADRTRGRIAVALRLNARVSRAPCAVLRGRVAGHAACEPLAAHADRLGVRVDQDVAPSQRGGDGAERARAREEVKAPVARARRGLDDAPHDALGLLRG